MPKAKLNEWYNDADIIDYVTRKIEADVIAGGFISTENFVLKKEVKIDGRNKRIVVLPGIRARTSSTYNNSAVTIDRYLGLESFSGASPYKEIMLELESKFKASPTLTPQQVKDTLLSMRICKIALDKFNSFSLKAGKYVDNNAKEFSRNSFISFLETEIAKATTSNDDKNSLQVIVKDLKKLSPAASWEEVKEHFLSMTHHDILQELNKYTLNNGKYLDSNGTAFDLNVIKSYLHGVLTSQQVQVSDIATLLIAGEDIKIVCPYNTGTSGSDTSGYHWTTGEITINQPLNVGDPFDVVCTAHDPLLGHDFTEEDRKSVEDQLNKLGQKIADETTVSRGGQAGPVPAAKFNVKIEKSGFTTVRQKDRTSCGAIAAEEILHRISGNSLSRVYSIDDAAKLREEQLQFMLKANPKSEFIRHLSEPDAVPAHSSDLPVAGRADIPSDELDLMAKRVSAIEAEYQDALTEARKIASSTEMAERVNAANHKRRQALQQATTACLPNQALQKHLLELYEMQRKELARADQRLNTTVSQVLANNKTKVYGVLGLTFALTALQIIQTALSAIYCPSADTLSSTANSTNIDTFKSSLSECTQITTSFNALILLAGAIGTLVGGIYANRNNFNDSVKPLEEATVKQARENLAATETALINVMVHNGIKPDAISSTVFADKLKEQTETLAKEAAEKQRKKGLTYFQRLMENLGHSPYSVS